MLLSSIYSWGNPNSENLRYCPRSSIQKLNKDSNTRSHRTFFVVVVFCIFSHWTWGKGFPPSFSPLWHAFLKLRLLLAENCGSRSCCSRMGTVHGYCSFPLTFSKAAAWWPELLQLLPELRDFSSYNTNIVWFCSLLLSLCCSSAFSLLSLSLSSLSLL